MDIHEKKGDKKYMHFYLNLLAKWEMLEDLLDFLLCLICWFV